MPTLSSGDVNSLTSAVGSLWTGLIGILVDAAPILAILFVIGVAYGLARGMFRRKAV